MTPCNKDCFNCPYPDCILDDVDYDDIREARERDKILTLTAEQKKAAAYQKAYYEANREEIAARKKAYYEANREEIAAYQKAYREANREEIAARKKAYREANREEHSRTGAIIRTARKAANLTQKELAGLLGMSQANVSLIESGTVPADIPAIAVYLPQLNQELNL